MKKYILGILSLVVASSMYATEAYHGKPHYKVVDITKILNGYEEGSYDDLLRVVDDYNRQNGINKRYFKGRTKDIKNSEDRVDLVPVAQYAGDYNGVEVEFGTEVAGTAKDTDFIPVYKVIEKKVNAIKEANALDKVAHYRSGNNKRFYFGNGNTVNDIIIENPTKFEKSYEKIKGNKDLLYPFTGRYKRVGGKSKLDALNISMEEYKKILKEVGNKSEVEKKEKIATLVKEKIEAQSNYKIIQKGTDLFTEVDGKKWKVYYNIEPITHYKGTWYDDPLEDKIFSDVYVYDSTIDSDSSAGRIIYTKKGNILVEDRLKYNEKIKVPESSYSSKDLDVAIKEAKENAKKPKPSWGEETVIQQYFRDKQELDETEFKAKWITPFEKGGQFETDLKNMKNEVEPLIEERNKIEKEKEEVSKKLEKIEAQPTFPNDYWKYTSSWYSDKEKKEYYDSKTPEQQKMLDEYLIFSKIKEEKSTISWEKYEEIEKIKKKYGFLGTWGSKGKWENFKFDLKRISMKRIGKNVEFRGKGRINGTVDLGEGDNHLTITEQLTGKYGTNIVLGPYAKLKNISRVYVGGGAGNGQGISASGRTSLSLDIDPNIKNKDGYLVQHALKDSDPNIKFLSTSAVLGLSSRNDFAIELMASKISENSIVDMGRNLNYEVQGQATHMNIITDSILHTVTEKTNLSNLGHSLLNVEIKDEVKRFSQEENDVYKSIVKAKKIGILQPTITTTNKRTLFSVIDDEREAGKLKNLTVYLKNREPREIIRDISQLNLAKEREKDILGKLETLKKSSTITTAIEKTRQLKELNSLKEYQELKLKEKLKKVNIINYGEVIKQLSDQGENFPQEKKDKIVNKIKNILIAFSEKDEEVLKKLGGKYDKLEEVGKIKDQLDYAKSELKTYEQGNSWKPAHLSSSLKYVLDELSSLKTKLEKVEAYTEEEIDKELSQELEAYRFENKKLYDEIKSYLFFTVREEEAFSELKNLINQTYSKNIYSKLNKVTKNEISTYTNLPFDINHNLFENMKKNKYYAKGGFISSRTVQDNFKGNTYTAYGFYENKLDKKNTLGFMVGGANTNFNEVYSRKMNYVATESSIKGVSAYMGAYLNKQVKPNFNWISGIGVQYGSYKINRQLKNNYQELTSKGKSKIGAINTYTGVILNFPVHEDVSFQVKGILSHTFVNQGKVSENDGLPLNIKAQNYNYIDGELGVALTKTLFDYDIKSSLSAGIYGVTGLYGYKNNDLNAKIKGSSSDFKITGDRIKKDATKIFIDYNVQEETGLNYGLEGTYLTNSEENNVRIGIKAGYIF